MSSSLEQFGSLPGSDFSRSGVPVRTTSISTSGTSVGHPVSFGSDFSGGTSTGSVVLTTSGGCVSTTSRVRATTGAVAELLAVAALNLAPVLGLRAVLREVALSVAVAAGDVVLLLLSVWIKAFLRKRSLPCWWAQCIHDQCVHAGCSCGR
jgi:hypothetical protein